MKAKLKIEVRRIFTPRPIVILTLIGELTADTHLNLTEKARELIASHGRNLLLDMQGITSISNAGLAGLYQVALLLAGDKPLDLDNGWEAFHAIGRRQNDRPSLRLKLLYLSPNLRDRLAATGMGTFLELYDDLGLALYSFLETDQDPHRQDRASKPHGAVMAPAPAAIDVQQWWGTVASKDQVSIEDILLV
jgi:hypothetical protein